MEANAQCTANAGPDLDPCVNTPAINLPGGGTWTGAPGTMLNGNTFTPNTVGTYTLTLTTTDSNGCVATDQKVIIVRPRPTVNAGLDATICPGACHQLNAVASSPNGPITLYSWSGGPLSNSMSASPIACPTGSGATYSVTVVDSESCNSQDQVTVAIQSATAVEAGPTLNICSNSTPVQLTGFSPAGGTWSGTGVNAAGLFTSASPGGYTLTYTFVTPTGCSFSDTRVVNVVAPDIIDAGIDRNACVGTTAFQLNPVTAGGTWSGSVYVTSTGVFTPSVVGSYSLTYSVNNGLCTSTDQIMVNVFANPTVDAGANASICIGGSTVLAASSIGGLAPNSYSWTNSASLSNGAILNPTASPTTTTSYTLTVVDARGCTASDFTTVTVNTPPVVNAGTDQTICDQSAPVQMTGQTPVGGSWSGTGVSLTGLFTSPGIGNYTLTYTFIAANGCSATDTKTISVIAPNGIDAGVDRTACVGTTAFQLNPVTAGGTWSGSIYVTAAGVFTPSVVGSYTLTYSVNTGVCTSTDQIVVNVFGNPTVDAGANASICLGGNTVLAASTNGGLAPNTFSWTNSSSLSNGAILNPTASPTSTTSYTLTVVDARGCTASDFVTVTVNTPPVVDAGANQTICDQSAPVQMTGQTPAGGSWSGTGVSLTGLFTSPGVGNYTLTYTFISANGCSATDTKTISVIAPNGIDAGVDRTACVGSNAFQLNPVTVGGTWSGSVHVTSAGVFSPSVVGTYTLTYTVNLGVCTSTDQITVTVFGNPTVDAGANATICAGGSTVLNGTVNGGLAPYNTTWNNSGSLSNSAILNPTATPASTTSYTLSIVDARGCTASDFVTVTVNALPVVEAGNDITVCDVSAPFQLTGQTPVGGAWSGSCVSSGGQFSPCGVGTYTLTYTFTNASGCVGTDTRVVNVTSSPSVDAGASMSVCRNEGLVDLTTDASATGTWSGNGVVDAANGIFNPIAAGVGTHTITITIGTGSCQVSDQKTVQVKAEPNVNAGPNTASCFNDEEVELEGATPSGGEWQGVGVTFDGNDDYYFHPSVGVGSYNLLYRYVDNSSACADTAYRSMTVNSLPNAAFTLPAPTGCSNVNIVPSNTSTGATSYSWNSGVGANQSGTNTVLNYSAPGTYNVRLIAITGSSCRDTAFQQIQILESPSVLLSSDVNQGCAPLQVSFNATTGGDNLNYAWNYGNGNTSNQASPISQTYIENVDVTNYTASLTVSNVCGSATDDINITVQPRPHAVFTPIIVSTTCSPVTVSFENNSTGTPTSCEWNFGDGFTSTMPEPETRTYVTGNTPTTFEIELTVHNNCGSDVTVEELTVNPNLVHASMSSNVNEGCTPVDVEVQNTGTGGTMIQYSFVPNVVAMGPTAQHSYNAEGSYTIYQYATDGCGFDTTSTVVVVHQSPTIAFTVSADETCQFEDLMFDATVTGASNFEWNFGDGETSSLLSLSKDYTTGGTYSVELSAVAANNCEAHAETEIVVHSNPVAMFEVANNEGCAPFDICPINSSVGATTTSWDFGDGFTNNDPQTCHTFTNNLSQPINQEVILSVANTFGCSDTYSTFVTINPVTAASFTLPLASSCEFPITIEPTGVTAGQQSYSWTVNSELASTDASPSFQFGSSGDFYIQLSSTNQYGCVDMSDATFTVHPPVLAAFSSDKANGCLDLNVSFVNQSTNATSFVWNFGDGDESVQSSPNHVFNEQGVFDVQLIATSPEGCKDTLVQHNLIETYSLPEADFRPSTLEATIFYPTINFTNESEDGVTYSWSFGDNSQSVDENPTHEFVGPGRWPVTLTTTNLFGCEDSKTIYVTITNDFQVYIPNSFTPNGDGLNDVFKPEMEGKEFIKQYKFTVFNRWGEVVFETEDPSRAWLGDAKGSDFYTESDTYSYRLVIEVEQSAETKVYQGLVSVIK